MLGGGPGPGRAAAPELWGSLGLRGHRLPPVPSATGTVSTGAAPAAGGGAGFLRTVVVLLKTGGWGVSLRLPEKGPRQPDYPLIRSLARVFMD